MFNHHVGDGEYLVGGHRLDMLGVDFRKAGAGRQVAGNALVLHRGGQQRRKRAVQSPDGRGRQRQRRRPLLDVGSAQPSQWPPTQRGQDVQPQVPLDTFDGRRRPVTTPQPFLGVRGHRDPSGLRWRVRPGQQSVLHVGYEEPSSILSNHQRQADFVIGELTSLSLDLDRITPTAADAKTLSVAKET